MWGVMTVTVVIIHHMSVEHLLWVSPVVDMQNEIWQTHLRQLDVRAGKKGYCGLPWGATVECWQEESVLWSRVGRQKQLSSICQGWQILPFVCLFHDMCVICSPNSNIADNCFLPKLCFCRWIGACGTVQTNHVQNKFLCLHPTRLRPCWVPSRARAFHRHSRQVSWPNTLCCKLLSVI